MNTSETRDRLGVLLTEPMAALGLDLEAVELTSAGKRRVLRVAVDKDGGVSMDDVADATREVSRVLDDTDVMGSQPYTLEVSSPGVDRPLTLPRHWRRNTDRLVKVTLAAGGTVTGRVAEAGESAVLLEVDGGTREVPYDQVDKAKVQIELKPFERAPRPPEEG
ncbi:ribosome maturation factor RimP [Nocardioides terrisoli]|uniref:ribosome maturation factor RimP n=1 Tax=Nocardioides terrisoli TaxID=3388267 RepID=UPI00287B9B95|nr:ribosome maturation factor RimP [Nocardioides marmorisolisilvae]